MSGDNKTQKESGVDGWFDQVLLMAGEVIFMRIFCMSYNLQMKRLMVGHHIKRGRANEKFQD